MLHILFFFVLLFGLCALTFYKREQLNDEEVFFLNVLMLIVLVIWWHVEYFWFDGIGVNFEYAMKVWIFGLIVGSIFGTFCYFLSVTRASG